MSSVCCCWSVTYCKQLLHYNPLAVLVHFRLSVHGGPQQVFAAVQPLAHLPLRRHSNSVILRRFVSLPVFHLYRQTFVLAIPDVTSPAWSDCQNLPRKRGGGASRLVVPDWLSVAQRAHSRSGQESREAVRKLWFVIGGHLVSGRLNRAWTEVKICSRNIIVFNELQASNQHSLSRQRARET